MVNRRQEAFETYELNKDDFDGKDLVVIFKANEDSEKDYFDYIIYGLALNCYESSVKKAVNHFKRNFVYNSEMINGYVIIDNENSEIVEITEIEYDNGKKKYIQEN